MLAGAQPEQAGEGGAGVLDPPVDGDAAGAGRALGGVRIEPQLEAADIEADVEGLVEVGIDP